MIPYKSNLHSLDLISEKIIPVERMEFFLTYLRFRESKVVFTNGCFDILHRGHIDYLAKARDLGDVLIVGLNSDNSVRRQNKGPARPLQDEHSRALILAAIQFVSAVIIFNDDTPSSLIEQIKPDVLVKGADYDALEKDPSSKKYIVGSDVVRAVGGEIITIPFLDGYSTSAIEAKIRK